LHTFLRHPLHIFSSGGPPPTRTHPGPIRSRVEPAGESRHCWDAVAILFAGPPSRGITIHSAGSPHPARASGAPPPPPPEEGVRAWRYLVESRIRVFPGLSPCSGPWWISPLGERLTGRGDASPLPCLSRSRHLAPCQPHPARAFGAPPPPRRGGGSAWRYQGSSRIRGATGGKPCTGPWGYRHGGWGLAGRGNSFPLPCLSRSRYLAPCQPYPARPSAGRLPIHSADTPTPSFTGSPTVRTGLQKEMGAAGEPRRQRRGL